MINKIFQVFLNFFLSLMALIFIFGFQLFINFIDYWMVEYISFEGLESSDTLAQCEAQSIAFDCLCCSSSSRFCYLMIRPTTRLRTPKEKYMSKKQKHDVRQDGGDQGHFNHRRAHLRRVTSIFH
jgi:hypothetical protein